MGGTLDSDLQAPLWESSEARTFDAKGVLCNSLGKGIQEVNLPVAILWEVISEKNALYWEYMGSPIFSSSMKPI